MPNARTRSRRRLAPLLLAGSLMLSLQVVGATAAHADPEVRSSGYLQLNAFWHERRDMDGPGYKKITWYAGAYSTDDFFYSDLYRYVSLCEPQPGKDRCRRTDLEIGATTSPKEADLVMDERLDSGTLDGTYAVKERGEGEARIITVHVELTAGGAIEHNRHQSERWVGDCRRARTVTEESSRSGVATGWLAGAVDRNLHSTRDAELESERTTTTVWPC